MAGNLTWDLLPRGVQSVLTQLRDKANALGRIPESMPAAADPHEGKPRVPMPGAGKGAGDAAQGVASFVAPEEAWEVPLMLAPGLKAAGKGIKAAVGASGLLAAGDTEASPLKLLRDVMVRFGPRSSQFDDAVRRLSAMTTSPAERERILSFAKTMVDKPTDARVEMLRKHREASQWLPAEHAVPERILKPEELEGASIIPLVGDSTGTHLVKINGKWYRMEGGAEYARTPGAVESGTGWLSTGGAGGAHQARVDIAHAANPGAPVFGMHLNMGPKGADYAAHTMDTFLAQLRGAKDFKPELFDQVAKDFLLKDDAETLRNIGRRYTSILDPKTQEMLYEPNAGAARSLILKQARKPGLGKKAGVPSAAERDNLIMEQDLIHEFPGATGRSVMRLQPGAETRLITPDVHRSYDRGPVGGYEGRLEFPVPYDLLFGKVSDEGYGAVQRALTMNPAINAKMTPKKVDTISKYIETMRQLRE